MVIAARENSERVIAEARAQASTLKKEARDSGVRQGQLHLRETVAQAEEDAKRLVEQASREAETLKQKGQARMEKAIREAINIVLGVQGGESK